ncbi:unnamed protein product [Hermetia illucens]|uniref:Uncharacterized protein n=1 Tax=Hermetia illucens TaxID=343691 RepID=A0A7R8V3V1_HERIL|nr:uncharacterized protein LOC119659745 [Hermetia illucens]CAD7092288.1 unnamed protein product [Hermetia illucens]
MNFIRGNFRKIQQSTIPVLCELFNSRQYVRQSPDIGRLKREISQISPCNRISINTVTPTSFLRIVGYYLRYSCRSIVIRLKEHLRNQRNMFFMKPPTEQRNEMPVVDIVQNTEGKDEAVLLPRICLDYLLAAAFGIGIFFFLANFNNISDLLKFSMRLEDTLRDSQLYVLLDPSQKDNY